MAASTRSSQMKWKGSDYSKVSTPTARSQKQTSPTKEKLKVKIEESPEEEKKDREISYEIEELITSPTNPKGLGDLISMSTPEERPEEEGEEEVSMEVDNQEEKIESTPPPTQGKQSKKRKRNKSKGRSKSGETEKETEGKEKKEEGEEEEEELAMKDSESKKQEEEGGEESKASASESEKSTEDKKVTGKKRKHHAVSKASNFYFKNARPKFNTSIFRIAKKNNEDVSYSEKSVQYLNQIFLEYIGDAVNLAFRICNMTGKKIITPKIMKYALLIVLPEKLGAGAVEQGELSAKEYMVIAGRHLVHDPFKIEERKSKVKSENK